MRLLILGGTKFVGRHVAEAALDRGWNVTLFNRGQSAPGGIPNTHLVQGDRFSDLERLLGEERFDLAVDPSAYFPRAIQSAAEVLQNHVARMAFVSTISVYADPNGTTIGSPRATVEDASTEVVNGETYGGLKALSEDAFIERWGERGWIVRPGLITGPYDPTDRFAYWLDRVRRFSAIVPPVRLDQPFQVVDGRALAEFILDGLMSGETDTVNTVGPSEPITFGELLDQMAEVCRVPAVSFLDRPADLQLPCELPADGTADAMFQIDPKPAETMGLRLPAMSATIQSTLNWMLETGRATSNATTDGLDVLR